MKQLRDIQPGELLIITSGEYSDYSILLVGRAVKQIPAEQLIKDWLLAHPEQQEDYKFNEDEFLAMLVREGYIQEVAKTEWHLSDYSKVSAMEIRELY